MTREGALEEASSSKAPQEAKAEMGRSAGRREYAGICRRVGRSGCKGGTRESGCAGGWMGWVRDGSQHLGAVKEWDYGEKVDFICSMLSPGVWRQPGHKSCFEA